MARLSDGVEGGKVRDSSGSPSDPAKNIHLSRIGKRVSQTVGDDLQDSVSCKVAVVVNVGFEHHAIHTVDGELIVFMKRELHVGLAELNLLPAGHGSRMKQTRSIFDGEFSRSR